MKRAIEFREANIRVGQTVNTLFCLVLALFDVKIHIFFFTLAGFHSRCAWVLCDDV